jgi:hypothetical protein
MTWGLRSRLKVALGAWALLFFLGVLPVAMLHNWKVGTLPVVEGTLSNHHVVDMKRKKTPDQLVRATLEFEGPVGHCRHNEVGIGPPNAESLATKVQLAVRPDSCGGYFFLPPKAPGLLGWLGLFVLIALLLMFVVSFIHFVVRYEDARQARGKPCMKLDSTSPV